MHSKMRAILVILILCVVTSVTWAQIKRRPTGPTSEPTQSENKMSPAFQEQGLRALDAIRRLPLIPSADDRHPGFEQRKLDAEKAIDEAKYKARTFKDKEVLKILRAAEFLIAAAQKRHVHDPDWKLLTDAASQCKVEITAEFEPDGLSALGRKQAAQKTCLKKQDAIVKMWGQQHP